MRLLFRQPGSSGSASRRQIRIANSIGLVLGILLLLITIAVLVWYFTWYLPESARKQQQSSNSPVARPSDSEVARPSDSEVTRPSGPPLVLYIAIVVAVVLILSVVIAIKLRSKLTLVPVPNCGNGDCLFLSIVQAAETEGIEGITVKSLREAVSDAADYLTLEGFQAQYIVHPDENPHMEGVKDLAELRSVMLTRLYWGDDFALPVIERKTGLKIKVLTALGEELKRPGVRIKQGEKFIHLRLEGQHYELLKDKATGNTVFVAP